MLSKDNIGKITKRYVNIKQFSEYTSIPIKTLYEWSSVGKIPSIRLGRKLLFDLIDIDRLMANMKCNDNQEEKTVNKITGEFYDSSI